MKIKLPHLIPLFMLTSVMAHAGAIRNLPGFASTVYGANDDGTYPVTGPDPGVPDGTPVAVPIGFPVNFYGQTFTNLFLNNNGNITFNSALGEFTPFGLVGTRSQIIAAFFADVDTRAGNVVTFGNDTVDGHQAFGVNWIGVGYFDSHVDKLNSFQLILINRSDRRPGDFDIEFNYDSVQWETGDASNGTNGLGGNSAVIGFSNGSGLPGTSLQFSGSGVPRSFLDLTPGGLIDNFLNTNVPGRYIIPIVNLTNTVLNVARFSQGSAPWNTQSYDDSGTNIQAQGSALACLAMALNYAGSPTDPGKLNTVLETDHDFVENEINWGPATRDASTNTLEFHAHRGSDFQFLSQALDGGHPVIARVTTAQSGGHYVLVIGEKNGHFIINDPGQTNATNLDFYNNVFETRGYVSDPPGDISEFDVGAGTATEVLVVDPRGRRTGYNASSGLIIEQIPQSVHFADSLEKSDLTGAPGTNTSHLVDIYQPMQGDYQIFLISTNKGNYKLVLSSFLANGSAGPRLNLTGTQNVLGVTAFQVHLGPGGLVSELFTNQYPWTATPTNGSQPLTVQFTTPNTDTAGHTITNWNWELGDGTISSDQNPSETYTNGGTFFPSLVAIDDAGNTVVGYGPSIFIPSVPFNAIPTNGPVPLSVQFTAAASDTSGSNIISWNWDFGDGFNSTLQNPQHTYTGIGSFTPVLAATNNAGSLIFGVGPSITVLPTQIVNGGFETGDFTNWTVTEDASFVDDGSGSGYAPHSGSFLAALGTFGTPGTLSQTFVTVPGRKYLLSLWLISDGATPNEFSINWNGASLFDQSDIPAMGWTNLQFIVTATSTTTTLQFGYLDDPSYLGLDDVITVQIPSLHIVRSGQNMVVSWPTNALPISLHSSTNMSPSALWSPVLTSPTEVSGQNFVTNPIAGKQMFFRLSP